MSRYFAEIDSSNIVTRVIVADSLEWCQEALGGTWIETADPYSDQPQEVTYCGPGFGADPTFPERFAPPWVMPAPDPETGVWSSYPKGAVCFYDGHLWKSTTDLNVWEPGVSAWHNEPEIEGVLPTWVAPTGSHDTYPLGFEVQHNGQVWVSDHAANVWEPGVSQWHVKGEEPVEPTIPNWVQPSGAHDAYAAGAEVMHNGQHWVNTHGNGNVWEPGVYGWVLK
jgi:hypothetical protein